MHVSGRRRGQTLIEFALIAPVFFGIFIGVLEIGRLMAAWISLHEGAQEAARIGSLTTSTENQIFLAAQAYSGWLGPDLTNCSPNAITASNCTSLVNGGVSIHCGASLTATP